MLGGLEEPHFLSMPAGWAARGQVSVSLDIGISGGPVTPEAAAMHLPSFGGAGDSSVTASPEPTCVLALRVKR